MLAAIKLNDEFFIYANKINNIRAYRVLTSELGVIQVTATQLLPDFSFCIRFGFSEFACKVFAALRISLHGLPLTLTLSPRVRGEREPVIGNFMVFLNAFIPSPQMHLGGGVAGSASFQRFCPQQRSPETVFDRRAIAHRQRHRCRGGRHLDVAEHRAGLAVERAQPLLQAGHAADRR